MQSFLRDNIQNLFKLTIKLKNGNILTLSNCTLNTISTIKHIETTLITVRNRKAHNNSINICKVYISMDLWFRSLLFTTFLQSVMPDNSVITKYDCEHVLSFFHLGNNIMPLNSIFQCKKLCYDC